MTYLITGATGLIGKHIIESLLEKESDCTELILPVRDVEKAKGILDSILEKSSSVEVRYIECDVETLCPEEFSKKNKADYIIHCAAPTKSLFMINNPVETADSIVIGTKNLLEIARRLQVKSMVHLSSMEAYGVVEDDGRKRTECELGEIDITSPRSCYPLGKRMSEHYCYLYYNEYHVPVKVARLSQVFGKGVNKTDNRVFMQFARAVLNEDDIVLKTEGKSFGNYCSVDDAVDAILTLLCKGKDGEIYNIVNEKNTMRIIDMANLVADKIANGKIHVKISREPNEKTGYAADTGLRLSGEKMASIGWKPQKDMIEMYEDVIRELKSF